MDDSRQEGPTEYQGSGRKGEGTTRPIQSGHFLYLDELPDLLASLSDLTKEEAKDFLDDVVRSREELAKQKVRDPWEF